MKNSLHKWVAETDDEQVLQYVESFFESLKVGKEDWWDYLSESDLASVNRGLNELDRGIRIPNEEVKNKIDQLLKSRD